MREGQGGEAHELGEALWVGEVGVLEVEAPGLQGAEQGFDLPAVGVGVNELAVGQRRRGRRRTP